MEGFKPRPDPRVTMQALPARAVPRAGNLESPGARPGRRMRG